VVYSPGRREGGPVDFLLREARKFGLGLVFASQQPEDFSPAAYSNSASKLVFQTTDPTLRVSKFLAAKCSNYSVPEYINQVISVLRQGEAFFITKNRVLARTTSETHRLEPFTHLVHNSNTPPIPSKARPAARGPCGHSAPRDYATGF